MPLVLCVFVGGLIAAGFGVMLYLSQRNYEARPTVPGRIVAAEIVRKPVASQTTGGGRLHMKWLLEVRHAYRVAGRDYTALSRGAQTTLPSAEGRGEGGPPAWLERMRADYPVGGAVTVHYRAADPGDSVIHIDRTTAMRVLLGAAAAMILSALVMKFGN